LAYIFGLLVIRQLALVLCETLWNSEISFPARILQLSWLILYLALSLWLGA